MPPKLYGWEHLTYLAIYAIVVVATLLLIHFFVKTDKQKAIAIKVIAGILLICIITNRISIAVKNSDFWTILPNTYCGTTSLSLALFVLFGKPNLKAYHFLWYIGVLGGLITMFYPDFLGQDISFMYLPTISGMLHHSMLLLLTIVMCQLKWFEPSLKNWKWFPIGICVFTIYGLFIMDIFKWDHAMCIGSALIEGTILNWWFILIFGSILLLGFLFLYEFIKIKLYLKKINNALNNVSK